jgi:hypothetical protein
MRGSAGVGLPGKRSSTVPHHRFSPEEKHMSRKTRLRFSVFTLLKAVLLAGEGVPAHIVQTAGLALATDLTPPQAHPTAIRRTSYARSRPRVWH